MIYPRTPITLAAIAVGVFLVVAAIATAIPTVAHAKSMVFEPNRVEHIQYFPQTDYRLDVYIVSGKKPGATALIVGGIQGDEEGGYLAADQFVDMSVEVGRLIIIPRANAKAVAIAERMTVVDMNRQFQQITYEKMRGAVETIKKYIGEADVFINFHDGWGFHRKEYTDWSYSPDRFGQSVVTDSDEYTCSNDTTINLREPAFIAISGANERINLEKYYLAYFNTRTFEDTSKYYASMTNASTYYVLTTECKPAFAIEASKNLPTSTDKVLVHLYAAIPLLKYYGIVVNESISPMTNPTLNRVVLSVDGVEYAMLPNKTLNVTQGATVVIESIYGNYKRGYTADMVGVGSVLDNNVERKMTKTGRVVVNIYKDSIVVGKIFLQVQKPQAQKPQVQKPVSVSVGQPSGKPSGKPAKNAGLAAPTLGVEKASLFAEVNGVRHLFPVGQNIILNHGDTFTIIDLILPSSTAKYSVQSINIKGFVPKGIGVAGNTGNDIGHEMIAGVSEMLTQYAVQPTSEDLFAVGEVYPVVASYSVWKDTATTAGASARGVPRVAKSELFYIQIAK